MRFNLFLLPFWWTERDSNFYKALFSPIYSLLFFSYGILVWNEFLTGAILFFYLNSISTSLSIIQLDFSKHLQPSPQILRAKV